MKIWQMIIALCLATSCGASALAQDEGVVASVQMGAAKRVRPGPHRPMPLIRNLTAVTIRLERGGCLGSCPDYRVEISGSGEIRYDGNRLVLVEGHHGAKVDPMRVAALVEQFRKADFWSLRPQYVAPITDNPGYRLTLTIDGQSKVVIDYVGQMVGMPAVVTALEKAVDDTAGVARWVKGNAETLPSLRAEGWSFSSREAGETLARAASDAPDDVAFGLIAGGAPVVRGGGEEATSDASALDNACLKARLDLARKLIAAGAAVAPEARQSALFAAVASAHPAIVAEILTLKPAINAPNREGYTPLMWLNAGPHPFFNSPEQTDIKSVIALLIAAGADPNLAMVNARTDAFAANANGTTALHMTIDDEVARALIRGGARVDARNARGETPLLTTFSEDVALALLDAGADRDARSSDGTTLASRAKQMGWKNLLARLKR